MKKIMRYIMSLLLMLSLFSYNNITFVKAGEAFDVTNLEELYNALTYEGNVVINVMNDIEKTLPLDYEWQETHHGNNVYCYLGSGEKILNLNGHKINVDDQSDRLLDDYYTSHNFVRNASLFVIPTGTELIINDTGSGLISMTTEMDYPEDQVLLSDDQLWVKRDVLVVDGGYLQVNGGEIHAGRSKQEWVQLIDWYEYYEDANGFQTGDLKLAQGFGDRARYTGDATRFTSGNAIKVYSGDVEINGGSFYGRGYDDVSMTTQPSFVWSFVTVVDFELDPCAALKAVGTANIVINDGEFNGRGDANSIYLKSNVKGKINSGSFYTQTNDYLIFPCDNYNGLIGDYHMACADGKRGVFYGNSLINEYADVEKNETRDKTSVIITPGETPYSGTFKKGKEPVDDLNYLVGSSNILKFEDIDFYYDKNSSYVKNEYYYNLYKSSGDSMGQSLTGWVKYNLEGVVNLRDLYESYEVGKYYYLKGKVVQKWKNFDEYQAEIESDHVVKIFAYDEFELNHIDLFVDEPIAGYEATTQIKPQFDEYLTVDEHYWYDETDEKRLNDTDLFVYKHDYTLHAKVTAKEGYIFKPSATATVNEKAAMTDWYEQISPEKSMEVIYEFKKCNELVDGVSVTNLNVPKEYEHPDYHVVCGDKSYGIKSYKPITWYDVTEETYLTSEDYFIEGHDYEVYIPIYTADSRVFKTNYELDQPYDFSVIINGSYASEVKKIDGVDCEKALMAVMKYTCYDEVIDKIAIHIDEPKAGKLPANVMYFTTEGYNTTYNFNDWRQYGMSWYDMNEDDYINFNEPLIAGHQYRFNAYLKADHRHEFYIGDFNEINTTATINDKQAEVGFIDFEDGSEYLQVSKIYTCEENELNLLQITDIDSPMPNQNPDYTLTLWEEGIELESIRWYDGNRLLNENDVFENQKDYTLEIKLKSKYINQVRQAIFKNQVSVVLNRGTMKVKDVKVVDEEHLTITCDITCKNTTKLQGYIFSQGSDSDPITIQLIPKGTSEVAYEKIVYGNQAHYIFDDVIYGDYICKVRKKLHKVYEFNWVVIDHEDIIDIHLQPTELPFVDVLEKEWYYGSVKEAYQLGLMGKLKEVNGNQYFGPDVNISRGMVATVLHRIEKNIKVDFKVIFTDVTSADLWYSQAITWAAQNQVVSGYKDGRFGPDDNIIRQDLAIMLRNFAKFKGLDVSQTVSLSDFKDEGKVDGYAYSAVAWCVKNGIMSGSKQNDGTYLNPKANATRAECAKMFSLLYSKMNN